METMIHYANLVESVRLREVSGKIDKDSINETADNVKITEAHLERRFKRTDFKNLRVVG